MPAHLTHPIHLTHFTRLAQSRSRQTPAAAGDARATGSALGIYSICSAHPLVIEAAMHQALDDGTPLLVEATANQVNQFGGYTGMQPADFRRFVLAIAHRVGLPPDRVLLGGDLHQNYVCAVHADPEAAPERRNPIVASEFCSTSITSRSGTTQAKVDAIVAHNPQVLYARCEERGYGLADITPERWTSELRAVANPMRADSRIYTLARFTVEDRRPGPVAS